MATIKCKGLTGVQFDLTVTMGTTTMNGLTALAQAVEGQEITTAMYREIHAHKDKSINQTDHGGDTLTAAGLVEGDLVYCIPRYSGAHGFKRQRQEEKLKIAVSKRITGTMNISPIEVRAKRLEVRIVVMTSKMKINKVYTVSFPPNSSVAFHEHLRDSSGPLFSREI